MIRAVMKAVIKKYIKNL